LAFGFRYNSGSDGHMAQLEIASPVGPQPRLYHDLPNERIYAHVGTGASWGNSANGSVVADTWYWIEMIVDVSGTTWTLDWRLDGADQPASTLAGQSATTITDRFLGNSNGITFSFSYSTAVSGTSSSLTDWPGEYDSKSIWPVSSGTHNLDASPSSYFYEHDGGSGTALQTAETAAWTRVDDNPLGGGSDRIYVTGAPGSGQYAEVNLGTVGGFTPSAVRVVESVQQSSAGGSVYTSKITDDGGTSLSDVQTALDPNTGSEAFKTKTFTTKPSGGAWTISALNSLKYRYGYTTDATPELRLNGVMVESIGTASAITKKHGTLLGVG